MHKGFQSLKDIIKILFYIISGLIYVLMMFWHGYIWQGAMQVLILLPLNYYLKYKTSLFVIQREVIILLLYVSSIVLWGLYVDEIARRSRQMSDEMHKRLFDCCTHNKCIACYGKVRNKID